MQKRLLRAGGYAYHTLFRPEPEGGYTVLVPSLPGCVTYGRTLEEAHKMVRDAIAGYLASLKKHGEPIPTDDGSFLTTITSKVPSRARAYA